MGDYITLELFLVILSASIATAISLVFVVVVCKFHKKTHRKALTLITIVYIVVLFMMLWWSYVSVVVYQPGPHPAPYIGLGLYQQEDSANRIVWVVKDDSILRGSYWEDIDGRLIYSNGTYVTYNDTHEGSGILYSINNSSLQLPTGKIKVGDLITVNAPWDGDAKLILVYTPDGSTAAETSIKHY